MLPLFWTLPPAMLSGTAAAGGIGLISAIGNLGSYFGPSIIGYLKDRTHTYTYGLLVVACFISFSSVLAFIIGRRMEKNGLLAKKSSTQAS
jgi:nitrate/nitrite transporter NarK